MTTNSVSGSNPDATKCSFIIKKKQRFCKFNVVPGQLYCGNHLYDATQVGEQRVPCPYDPAHTVVVSELDAHVKKCPKALLILAGKAEPYYAEDINAGSDEEPELRATAGALEEHQRAPLPAPGMHISSVKTLCSAASFSKGRAALRSALAASWGPERFAALLAKVQDLCDKLQIQPETHILRPPECEPAMGPGVSHQVTEKHMLQQASMIGNMQRVGLLPAPPDTCVIEMGAGKGLLAAMMAECCGVQKVVLEDRRNFKNKADKCLRSIAFKRLRVDLKDYNVQGTPILAESPQSPWMGVGKHLCGAATDFMLRACMRDRTQAGVSSKQPDSHCSQPVAAYSTKLTAASDMGLADKTAHGDATAATARDGSSATAALPQSDLTQLPQATAAAHSGHAGNIHNKQPEQTQTSTSQLAAGIASTSTSAPHHVPQHNHPRFRGLAVAPCCHHRCGWRAYVGKSFFTQQGFTPEEFEVISWMTGWALCGHEAPPGTADVDAEDGSDQEEDKDACSPECSDSKGLKRPHECMGMDSADVLQSASASMTQVTEHQHQTGNQSNVGLHDRQPAHVNEQGTCSMDGHTDAATDAVHVIPTDTMTDVAVEAEQSMMVEVAGDQSMSPAQPFNPSASLPRHQRIAFGQMCKHLIDVGRLHWLQSQGLRAEFCVYIQPEVSGENKLLLAVQKEGH